MNKSVATVKVDPAELREWLAKHKLTDDQIADQFRAGDKRNNYGVTGRGRPGAPKVKK